MIPFKLFFCCFLSAISSFFSSFYLCVHVCRWPWKPEEGVGSPEADVTGSYEFWELNSGRLDVPRH